MKSSILKLGVVCLVVQGLIGCQNTDIAYVDYQKTAEEPYLMTYAVNSARTKYNQPLPDLKDLNLNLQKVSLGNMLYHDTRLSGNGKLNCASCHGLAIGGDDNMPVAIGIDGQMGPINSPTVLNSGFNFKQFWDGRAPNVEKQAGMPILNPIEMAMPNEKEVLKRLSAVEGYKQLFAEAFPNEKNPITFANIEKAIGAFERTLMTTDRFDKFLNGDMAALTTEEKKGLGTFISAGCITCHAGAALGGDLMMKFGLFAEYAPLTGSKVVDNGKFDVTKNEADKFIFKSQSLRNVEKTHPYFHDGSVTDLKQAIQIMAKTELGKDLTATEVDEIHAFLIALTGEIAADKIAAPVMF